MTTVEVTNLEGLASAIRAVNIANVLDNLTWGNWIKYVDDIILKFDLCDGGKKYLDYITRRDIVAGYVAETFAVPDFEHTGNLVYIEEDL